MYRDGGTDRSIGQGRTPDKNRADAESVRWVISKGIFDIVLYLLTDSIGGSIIEANVEGPTISMPSS
jgi:hypothetical protein